MAHSAASPPRPRLKDLVLEASHALARLDAERLEELALSCQALNRSMLTAGSKERAQIAAQAEEARSALALFGRVLGVTHRNLSVMNHLRSLRTEHLEYSEAQARGRGGIASAGLVSPGLVSSGLDSPGSAFPGSAWAQLAVAGDERSSPSRPQPVGTRSTRTGPDHASSPHTRSEDLYGDN